MYYAHIFHKQITYYKNIDISTHFIHENSRLFKYISLHVIIN